ncbi:MAG: CDP-glucose 4,6-dehydratase, partial [Patescibacteria group bacterium]|nr:CDP-glucose 4,6-dehydratase [Patescibacteria group bacterium]
PTKPSLFKAVNLEKQVESILGDVRNANDLHSAISKSEPQFVFHLAAQPLVLLSYEKPVQTIETNVMGTVHLMESVRKVPSVRVCINFTSDKCYENLGLDHSFKEDDPLGGFDPYSASKGASELVTASYRNSFFNQKVMSNDLPPSVSSVRAGNVIGGGDWAESRIVPDTMRALISENKVRIRNPNAVRPWQHVLESISGLLWLATRMWEEPGQLNQAWNFGPDDSCISVKDLTNQIIDQWGKGEWENISNNKSNTSHEASSLKLDCTKANNLLKWHHVYDISTAIAETVSWYKTYYKEKNDMNDFTCKQIESYCTIAKKTNIVWTAD